MADKAKSKGIGVFHFIPFQEKINFARHLSVAVKSGLPLLESMRLIEKQTTSKSFSKLLGIVIQDVNNGQSLAQGLARFDYVFGEFFINIVRVGESSGNLSSSLLHLSEELKKQRDINHRVKSALVYPMVILLATTAMTIFLTTVVFPKLLPIFSSLKVELPLTTRIVIAVLKFLNLYWIHLIVGVVILAVGFRLLLRIKKVHAIFDRIMLVMPIFSPIIINLTLANFTRSLSVLLKSGMTLVDALFVSRGTFHNMFYRKHVDAVAETVRRGENMAKYMMTMPKLFPPMLVGMINVGENTGNLEENLLYLAEYYTEEVDNTVQNLTSLLEPLLILGMGLLVGFIAVSIIMPIYSITQGLKV